MWIELFGAPGVGKSTTYQAILPRANLPGRNQVDGNTRDLAELIWSDPSWLAWHDHALAAYASGERRRYEPRIRTFRRKAAQAVSIVRSGRPALMDDLLCQRGQSIAACGPKDWAVVGRYFELVPPPRGVIVLTGEPEEIKRRNTARGRDLSNETDVALRVVDEAVPILKRRGIALVELDAMQPRKETAQQALDFVRGILG